MMNLELACHFARITSGGKQVLINCGPPKEKKGKNKYSILQITITFSETGYFFFAQNDFITLSLLIGL